MTEQLSDRALMFIASLTRDETWTDPSENRRIFMDAGFPVSERVIEAQARFGGYAYKIGTLSDFNMGLWRWSRTPSPRDVVEVDSKAGQLVAFASQSDLQSEFWLNAEGQLLYDRVVCYSSVSKRIEDDAVFFERELRKPGAPFTMAILSEEKVAILLEELRPEPIDEASDLKVRWWQSEGLILRESVFESGIPGLRHVWLDAESGDRKESIKALLTRIDPLT